MAGFRRPGDDGERKALFAQWDGSSVCVRMYMYIESIGCMHESVDACSRPHLIAGWLSRRL